MHFHYCFCIILPFIISFIITPQPRHVCDEYVNHKKLERSDTQGRAIKNLDRTEGLAGLLRYF